MLLIINFAILFGYWMGYWMLQAIILIIFGVKVRKIVEKKGRKKTRYQLMMIGMWFGGEVLGVIFGGIVVANAGMTGAGDLLALRDLLISFIPLLGGISGVMIAFYIAHTASPDENIDKLYRDIDYAVSLGARAHFGTRAAATPSATHAYTDGSEKASRPVDERIQE